MSDDIASNFSVAKLFTLDCSKCSRTPEDHGNAVQPQHSRIPSFTEVTELTVLIQELRFEQRLAVHCEVAAATNKYITLFVLVVTKINSRIEILVTADIHYEQDDEPTVQSLVAAPP